MSKDPLSKIRAGDVYKNLMRVLAEHRIEKADWSIVDKRPHPSLTVRYAGRERSMTFPGTPSGRGSAAKFAGVLRRMLKEMLTESHSDPQPRETGAAPRLASDAAPAPSRNLSGNETMSGSTGFPAESRSVFAYRGQQIEDRGEALSLTDMWKASGSPSGRAPNDWRTLASTSEFADHVAIILNAGNSGNDLFQSVRGGRSSGTWAHWQVALAYAKYLSPEFHMWCNQVVRERMEARRPVDLSPDLVEIIRRDDGISRMLAHKVTELEKSVRVLLAYVRSADPMPSYDLAGTVTALMMIEMAGVRSADRVRGTSSIVTRHMKNFCLANEYGAAPTPEHIDPDRRWRFPRKAATEWLFGHTQGVELIRAHIARQRAKLSKSGQMALQLVGARA